MLPLLKSPLICTTPSPMLGEKAEDSPVVGQLRKAWKTPGIPWGSWCGRKLWANKNKPHSHFCLLLGGVGHVDYGSFCVCVHCGEQEKQSWSRDGRGVTAALDMLQRGIQLGWGEGDAWAPLCFPQHKDWVGSKAGSKQNARLHIPNPSVDPKLHSAHFCLQG